MFWICAANSANSTEIFSLLLNRAYTVVKAFSAPPITHQRGDWRCTRNWEWAQLVQLAQGYPTPCDIMLGIQSLGNKGGNIQSDGACLPKYLLNVNPTFLGMAEHLPACRKW